MKIIFICHAELDYLLLEQADYIGFGLDLAPLSTVGRKMAAEVAANPLLDQAEILISSSVTPGFGDGALSDSRMPAATFC